MLDASPLIIEKLRHHCYHLTGVRVFDYRGHHTHQREAFARKLQVLRQQDDSNLLVSESPLLGGFGHLIDGALFNVDTLKYYESLIALSKAGLLAQFRANSGKGKKVVMEIGAGWGGFAYQFKTLCPNITYIIIDLPQTLLFSAVYLRTLFPSASVLTYGDGPMATLLKDYKSYDFIFLPHYFLDDIRVEQLDLTINMVSFQEMTTELVDHYVRKVYQLECPNLYSLNRERSRYNSQLTTVSSVLSRYYDLTRVKVLDVPYTVIDTGPDHGRVSVRRFVRSFVRKLLRGNQSSRSIYSYRHLVGIRSE